MVSVASSDIRFSRSCCERQCAQPSTCCGIAATSKSRRRRPRPRRGGSCLCSQICAWLEPLRKAEGPLCCLPNLHFRLNYLGDKAGIGWRQNALRHSYASYRLADTPDAARVALEMGNSPEKLFRHYRELVTPDAAKEWFAIMPSQE